MSQLENHPFVCPYHGRVKDQDVTTQKSCARCMDELRDFVDRFLLLNELDAEDPNDKG